MLHFSRIIINNTPQTLICVWSTIILLVVFYSCFVFVQVSDDGIIHLTTGKCQHSIKVSNQINQSKTLFHFELQKDIVKLMLTSPKEKQNK